MSGSNVVNANMAAWEKTVKTACAAAMDMHIKRSEAYARTQRAWTDRTGAAVSGLQGKTDIKPVAIISSISHQAPHGEFLELRRDFGGKYRILEAARSNNLSMLWARLKGILSR